MEIKELTGQQERMGIQALMEQPVPMEIAGQVLLAAAMPEQLAALQQELTEHPVISRHQEQLQEQQLEQMPVQRLEQRTEHLPEPMVRIRPQMR